MPTGYPHLPARVVQLDNGLRALLLQDAGSSQLAIAAGVPAGSLDEPPAWPGLAHFLEHALFLGSASAPHSGEFARRIQQAGGRYNARTLNRHTLYHLEVPARLGAEALGLLLDLLTRPLLAPARLQAERGVLDAEYRARCADPGSQTFAAVSQCLNPAHPLAAFHHGHADSLRTDDPQFHADLHAWHARHYASDQLYLLLCGPQSLDDLQVLLDAVVLPASRGAAPPRDWPALWPAQQPAVHLSLAPQAPQRMSLWLALPAHPQQASLRCQLELLLQAGHPGSLLARWRQQRRVRQLACTLHDGGSQQLLEISLLLDEAAHGEEGRLAAELRAWLLALPCHPALAGAAVFTSGAACALAWEEYALPAMERALGWLQRWMDEPDCQPWASWPAPASLRHWLQQQKPQHWLLQDCQPVPHGALTPCFPVRWQQQPLRWVTPAASACHLDSHALQQALTAARPPATAWPGVWQRADSSGLRPAHGLLALCWHLPAALAACGLPARLALERAWQQEQGEARLLGAQCRLQHDGPHLLLELQGPTALLPVLAARLCTGLLRQQPDDWRADWQQELDGRRSGLLIRRLLLESESSAAGVAQLLQMPDAALARQMHTLLDACTLSVLQLGDGPAPVLPGQPAALPHAGLPGCRWQLASAGGEHAALLCLDAPAADAGWQLAWQALRLQLEAPFFQRLRTEQGLGYIVFCRYRLAASGPQLQFGVQSPHAGPPRLQAAILDFLQQPPAASGHWQDALAASLQAGPPWQQRLREWLGGVSTSALLDSLHGLSPTAAHQRLASLLPPAAPCG